MCDGTMAGCGCGVVDIGGGCTGVLWRVMTLGEDSDWMCDGAMAGCGCGVVDIGGGCTGVLWRVMTLGEDSDKCGGESGDGV